MVKSILKKIISGLFVLLIMPIFLVYKIIASIRSGDSIFWTFSQALSLFPGTTGSYLRTAFYSLSMTSCFSDCLIGFGTIFAQVDTELGHSLYIGPYCNIGTCKIEDFCTLGSNVHILSGKNQHNFDDIDRPIQDQGGRFEKIVIGEDTWIGNGAIIMANVGKKCIIGAGSVVTRDVEDFSIVAGNPAKLIRKRV